MLTIRHIHIYNQMDRLTEIIMMKLYTYVGKGAHDKNELQTEITWCINDKPTQTQTTMI